MLSIAGIRCPVSASRIPRIPALAHQLNLLQMMNIMSRKLIGNPPYGQLSVSGCVNVRSRSAAVRLRNMATLKRRSVV